MKSLRPSLSGRIETFSVRTCVQNTTLGPWCSQKWHSATTAFMPQEKLSCDDFVTPVLFRACHACVQVPFLLRHWAAGQSHHLHPSRHGHQTAAQMATTAPALEPSASREIPPRRVEVHDPSQLPSSGLCTTPGGTMFSTTPGGEPIRTTVSTFVATFAFVYPIESSALADCQSIDGT